MSPGAGAVLAGILALALKLPAQNVPLRIVPGLCFMHSSMPESPISTNGRFDTTSRKFGMPSNVRVSAKK